MKATTLLTGSNATIFNGVAHVPTCTPAQTPRFGYVADNSAVGMQALIDLTTHIGGNLTSSYTSVQQWTPFDDLGQMVTRANAHLGPIQIKSVAAIFADDTVSHIRIVAEEGNKVRVIYQEPNTKARNLLTNMAPGYFDELIQTVSAKF